MAEDAQWLDQIEAVVAPVLASRGISLNKLMEELAVSPRDAHSLMMANAALREHFNYVPGATTVGTRLPEVLERRVGVCQDFAHVFLAVARHAGAQVLLKPASPGTGVIAGGGVRAVLEAAGVRDILTKSMGSANVLNVVYATLHALESLKSAEVEARQRGKELKDVTPFWNRKKNGQPQQ